MKRIILLIFLVGCSSSIGTLISQEDVAKIKKGETTKAEIVKLFGDPQSINIISDSTYVINYFYSNSKAVPFGSPNIDMTQFQIIFYKGSDIVKDYIYNKSKW